MTAQAMNIDAVQQWNPDLFICHFSGWLRVVIYSAGDVDRGLKCVDG